MALQDILAAITAKADQQIEQARKEHQSALAELRDAHSRQVEAKNADIAKQKDARQKQLLMKTESHSAAVVATAELKRKQELVDELYETVLKAASELADAEQQKILEACVKHLPKKGTILPSKAHASALKKIASGHELGESIDAAGGFIFVSDTTEHNFTFEHLVQNVLRPETEIEVANQLFV